MKTEKINFSEYGSNAPDNSLIRINLNGKNYAFIAGEVYELQKNPDADLGGKQQLTKAYRLITLNKKGGEARGELIRDKGKLEELAEGIFLENTQTPQSS